MGDIQWNDNLKLGNETVDAQHRKLFELASELVSCLDGKCDLPMLYKALDFLIDYTVQHFNEEEALQIMYKYPDYNNHKKLHEDFRIGVGELIGNFRKSGSMAALSASIRLFIVDWLVHHIQIEDQKLGAYMRSKK